MQVKFKYVSRETDRHGKVRVYFRRKIGEPKIPMPEPGTAEFAVAYAAALDGKVIVSGARQPAGKRGKTQAPRGPEMHTLHWLCAAYFSSAEFGLLGARTRHVRRQIIEHCLHEPIAPGSPDVFAELPLDRFTSKAVRILRDRKRDLPEAANGRVKALRQVYKWAVEAESDVVTSNPTRDVAYLKGPDTGGHHSWTIDEVRLFEARHPVGTTPRLALALLLYTGQRRSDVVRMSPRDVRKGWITLTQQKNIRSKPVTLSLPIVEALRAVIEASEIGPNSFLVSQRGQPFTEAGFGNSFRQWCDEAGLKHCSAHGLRKATAARLAEAGCSDREIMAITGHTTSKEVDRYTRGARQRVMAGAAMLKLTDG